MCDTYEAMISGQKIRIKNYNIIVLSGTVLYAQRLGF